MTNRILCYLMSLNLSICGTDKMIRGWKAFSSIRRVVDKIWNAHLVVFRTFSSNRFGFVLNYSSISLFHMSSLTSSDDDETIVIPKISPLIWFQDQTTMKEFVFLLELFYFHYFPFLDEGLIFCDVWSWKWDDLLATKVVFGSLYKGN